MPEAILSQEDLDQRTRRITQEIEDATAKFLRQHAGNPGKIKQVLADREANIAKLQANIKSRQGFLTSFAAHKKEAGEFQEKAIRGFTTRRQLFQSRQVAGLNRNVAQGASRQGLSFSGLQSGAQAQGQAVIATRGLEGQLGFEADLEKAAFQDRQSFIRGEQDFLRQMTLLNRSGEIQERLVRIQADIAADQLKLQTFNEFLGGAGEAIGFLGGGA